MFSKREMVTAIVRILVGLLFLLPVIWMVRGGLLPVGSALSQRPHWRFGEITLENFRRVWDLLPITRYTLNSLLVVGIAVPGTLLVSSWAGLAMAHLPKAGQRRWIFISLAVLMVPGIALWMTRFLIYKYIGIYNSVWALVAPILMGTSPFYVLMFYRAFHRVSPEIYESARLDGAGVFRIWWSIALPIASPTAIGVGLLSFAQYWGDFTSPLLYLRSEKRYTLAIALQLLQQLSRSDWPLLMAGAVMASLIPVLVFLGTIPFLVGELRGQGVEKR